MGVSGAAYSLRSPLNRSAMTRCARRSVTRDGSERGRLLAALAAQRFGADLLSCGGCGGGGVGAAPCPGHDALLDDAQHHVLDRRDDDRDVERERPVLDV